MCLYVYVFVCVCIYIYIEDRSCTEAKVLCYKLEGCWLDPGWCQWIFHWHKFLPIALWPWCLHSLEQKWVPGAFSGGKMRPVRKADNLPPSCALFKKSGSFNFLETSGPLQACNGTALIIYIYIYLYSFLQIYECLFFQCNTVISSLYT